MNGQIIEHVKAAAQAKDEYFVSRATLSGEGEKLVALKIFVPTRKCMKSIACKCGIGEKVDVQARATEEGRKYFVTCDHFDPTRDFGVDPDEIELLVFDKARFLECVREKKLPWWDGAQKRTGKSRSGRKRTRAKGGMLTQADVAKDFGVSRHTICRWEATQTCDGRDNSSNPYHYYKSLRTNPDLRGAYETLAKEAGLYLRARDKAKAKKQRFKFTFDQFNEELLKHNQKH